MSVDNRRHPRSVVAYSAEVARRALVQYRYGSLSRHSVALKHSGSTVLVGGYGLSQKRIQHYLVGGFCAFNSTFEKWTAIAEPQSRFSSTRAQTAKTGSGVLGGFSFGRRGLDPKNVPGFTTG